MPVHPYLPLSYAPPVLPRPQHDSQDECIKFPGAQLRHTPEASRPLPTETEGTIPEQEGGRRQQLAYSDKISSSNLVQTMCPSQRCNLALSSGTRSGF